MAKILLDAGHGGVEPGAVFEGRQEKDDTLNLVLAVGQRLHENGVDVSYTRTTDVYFSPFEKITIANNSHADFMVSVHRNSCEQPNSINGIQTLVFDHDGMKTNMAERINQRLEKIGFANLGIEDRPNLVILKNTKLPTIMEEVGYINCQQDNALLDHKFNDIAGAIAEGIMETIQGMVKTDPVYYRVQVGQFQSRANALCYLNKLQDADFPGFIIYENGIFKVQSGAFADMERAVSMEDKLRKCGYNTFITT